MPKKPIKVVIFQLTLALFLMMTAINLVAMESSEIDMWEFFIKIAEGKIESEDQEAAFALYDLLLEKRISGPSKEGIRYICESLVNTVKPNHIESIPESYWRCPKEIIRPWADGNPKLVKGAPRLKWCKYPEWPWWAKFRKQEGIVQVTFDITAEGTTENIIIVNSSRSIFNKEAINSAKTCKFYPKTVYGYPVKETGYEFKFIFEH